MELNAIKQLIKRYSARHGAFVMHALQARRYYDNQTDILYKNIGKDASEVNPARSANNKIPGGFFGLLIDQKASYVMSSPPSFSVDNKKQDELIAEVLGDKYKKNAIRLLVDASCTGVGFVHYWQGKDGFKWGVVDSEQVYPIWDKSLDPKLVGILRTYKSLDELSSDELIIYEYWNDTTCETFARRSADTVDDGLFYYSSFFDTQTGEPSNTLEHGCGEVPFIAFFNNARHTSDLNKIKHLIDVYDKVYSGFINDLDDIQELIFIISGYGGSDLAEFMSDLKKYKTIKIDNKEDGGVETLSIEIPIEARNSVLKATRKAIFEQGMGFDPDPEKFGNSSGVALKFMYALLEMKAGLLEVEFRVGFARLVRAILRMSGSGEVGAIKQVWRRTAIQNDLEVADICQKSVGLVSSKTILQYHPFVEDANAEAEAVKEEKLSNMETFGLGGHVHGDEQGEKTETGT